MKTSLTDKKGIKSAAPVIILALAPLAAALLLCAIEGVSPQNVYLPSSQWNDELLYYKIVGGAARYGEPLGWFGYNESRGALASFGAWSPLAAAHYIVYAALFGWGYLSPYICNTLLCCAALALFARLARLTARQAAAVGGFYCCMLAFARYQFSVMSESLFVAGVALFAAFAYYAYDAPRGKRRNICAALTLVTAAFLTAIRPNYAALFIVAGFALYRVMGKASLAAAPLVCAGSLAAYFWTERNLCAAYVQPMIRSDLTGAFSEGFFAGLKMFVVTAWDRFKDLALLTLDSAATPSSETGGLAVFAAACAALLAAWLYCAAKKKKDRALTLAWLLALACELAAVVVFSWSWVAARHLLPITLAAVFAIVKSGAPRELRAGGIAATACLALIASVGMLNDPYYSLPVETEERARSVSEAQAEFADAIELDKDGVSWENTVIWSFDDGDGEQKRHSDWGLLTALPDGAGINLVFYYYADAEFDNLQSKYLYACPDSLIGEKCLEKGGRLLVDCDEYELWLMPKYNA